MVLGKNQVQESNQGEMMHQLMSDLFPICRSITGNGVRETLKVIKQYIPLDIFEVPSGTKVFDWTIPKEWNIKDAYVMDESGNKVIEFKKNNLHVVGYSIPINRILALAELQNNLYSLPDQPDAIPYVTSYYSERWGFCLSHKDREQLKDGNYRVVIDSELKDGYLTYGELIIPGKTKKEIFLSTYICHPSLANDNLSGVCVTVFLAKWLLEKQRRYTYRIIFIPETIGSLTYLSKNIEAMKKNIMAGFNLTCVGGDSDYSFLPSRRGNTLADRAALNILKSKHLAFKTYSFLDRGSDERQYCSPGIDLPVVSVMRSKYGDYSEYHTSLDNLNFVTPSGLEGTYDILKECFQLLERNKRYTAQCLGEPQLGRRGLRSTISIKSGLDRVKILPNIIAYSDGSNDLIDISNIINRPVWELYPVIEKLENEGLIKEEES